MTDSADMTLKLAFDDRCIEVGRVLALDSEANLALLPLYLDALIKFGLGVCVRLLGANEGFGNDLLPTVIFGICLRVSSLSMSVSQSVSGALSAPHCFGLACTDRAISLPSDLLFKASFYWPIISDPRFTRDNDS